jgi:hypothetical protein
MIKLRFLAVLGLCAAFPAAAQGLSAGELLPEVEKCSLRLTGEAPPMDPDADALVLKVGKADIGGGVTSHLFYFAPGKAGQPDHFGLLLDATVNAVRQALPDLARPVQVNGYHRDLTPIADPDGSSNGDGKSLLACRADPLT